MTAVDHAAPREGESALLPCPFCGTEAASAQGRDGFRIMCRGCYGCTAPLSSPHSAKRAWNTRSAPPSGASSVEAMATLDEMAERLREHIYGPACREDALDLLAYTLTGLPPGPERDAAVAAILARLSGTNIPDPSQKSAAPSGLVEAARAYLAAVQNRDEIETAFEDGAITMDQYAHRINPAQATVKRAEAALDAALAGQPAGDGWSFDMEAAPRDGRLLRVARHMGAWGWILGTSRWHGGGLLSGWISRGVGKPGDGLGLGDPDCWAPFDPPAQRPVQGGDQ